MIALADLNGLPAQDFVRLLAGIFEHSPWVAERAAAVRPFDSRAQLLEAMRTVVDEAAADEQMALIRAHPALGLRGRHRADLTLASAQEQKGAGLHAATEEELIRLDDLNARYAARFSMPFILAVRGYDPASIIADCESRLTHDTATERQAALRQIGLIAGYRLADVVAP